MTAAAAELPDDIAELLRQRTAGWPPEKKAALAARLQQDITRLRWRNAYPTPLDLGQALDHTVERPPHLELINRALVDVAEGRCRRLMISLGSQHGKTMTVSNWGVLWFLLRNPDLRLAIASYELSLARDQAAFVRDQVVTHGLDAPALGGEDRLGMRIEHGRHAAGRFRLDGYRGGVVAVGTQGPLTGRPVDGLFLDDPIKGLEEADSKLIREKVWKWWTGTARTRLGKASFVIVIGTRWHEDDVIGRLQEMDRLLAPEDRQWRVINIPIIAGEGDALGRAPGEYLSSDVRGRDEQEYISLRRDVGERVWAAVYQGQPAPSEGGIFKWDWIRPYRVRPEDVPALARVVVAVDTTGGGSDEAGIIGAGRDASRRTYVIEDRSGHYTAAGQWRHAWFTVLDLEADVLVYEANLVDPVQRKAIPASWARLREQAQALAEHGAIGLDPQLDGAELDARIRAAAVQLAGRGDDDVVSSDDPLAALTTQLVEALPYATRILTAPEQGPARVEKVHATRGKRTRAEPVSQAYETGQVSHAGVFPALEQELVTWQEGQDSPNRLDAAVWAWTWLNSVGGPSRVRTATGRALPTGPSSRR